MKLLSLRRRRSRLPWVYLVYHRPVPVTGMGGVAAGWRVLALPTQECRHIEGRQCIEIDVSGIGADGLAVR